MPRLKDEPGSEVVQYTKTGNNHVCIHEEKLEDHDRRIGLLEQGQITINGMFSEIKDEIAGLREDLSLTKQKNGYQDKSLEEIKENKKTETEFNYKRASIILSICLLVLTAFTVIRGWM